MLTKKAVWEQLTGKYIAEAIVKAVGETFEDFAEVQSRYLRAMQTLQGELGTFCKEEMDAIDQQTHSLVLFSGMLGLKANLDNFVNPTAQSFLTVDSEVYLREETAHRLPEYENAQQVRCGFYAQLSVEQQVIYEDVIEYACYLETVGPKLAHYYGYILGNDFLPLVIPGYHPDSTQTAQYTALLKRYFGKDFE